MIWENRRCTEFVSSVMFIENEGYSNSEEFSIWVWDCGAEYNVEDQKNALKPGK